MEIKMFKKKCPMCDTEFSYWDTAHVPKTCGSRQCDRNYVYQQNHKDIYGNVMDPSEINKWN